MEKNHRSNKWKLKYSKFENASKNKASNKMRAQKIDSADNQIMLGVTGTKMDFDPCGKRSLVLFHWPINSSGI